MTRLCAKLGSLHANLIPPNVLSCFWFTSNTITEVTLLQRRRKPSLDKRKNNRKCFLQHLQPWAQKCNRELFPKKEFAILHSLWGWKACSVLFSDNTSNPITEVTLLQRRRKPSLDKRKNNRKCFLQRLQPRARKCNWELSPKKEFAI